MGSAWGRYVRVSLFGESHGPAVGVTLEGLPAGMTLDRAALAREMARRAPGFDESSTSRREPDEVELLSGVYNGRLTGTPLCALIRNFDARPEDYADALDVPRPGHADLAGHIRYFGFEDPRGGGHFSGRLTAPLAFAGEACRQWLAESGVRIASHIRSIAEVEDEPFGEFIPEGLRDSRFPTLDPEIGRRMRARVLEAKRAGDSVGGVIECAVTGVPAGVGAPFFDSVESVLSSLLFSVPGVKGVEFGLGFEMARRAGSACNDEMRMEGETVRLTSNRSGGVNGGVCNGMPIVFRAAVRPTPSIRIAQKSVSLRRGEDAQTSAGGRHDPCIVPRAVPVIDAVAALGIAEMWKERAAASALREKEQEP